MESFSSNAQRFLPGRGKWCSSRLKSQVRRPIAGIVIVKKAVEGDYVGVGTKIYEIADLSRVWVYLDAYESDLAWLRHANFRARNCPTTTLPTPPGRGASSGTCRAPEWR